MTSPVARWTLATVLFAVAAVGAGCSTEIRDTRASSPAVVSTSFSAADPAATLNTWYQKRDSQCGSATRPAFLCSGVTLRATTTSPDFLPWDPSPDGLAKGGISASWLRIDMNFPDTVRPNGFVFYPAYDAPTGTRQIEVLCAFPFDGDTWNRRTLQGCGPHTSNVDRSRPCQDLGIQTAEQWLINYYTPGHARHSHQCGWDVRIGSPATADRFQQSIRARAGLQWDQWRFTSELILRTWPTGVGASLPIHSFFYRVGNSQALNDARQDQTRYFRSYGKALPIVRLTLPTSQAGTASFSYSSTDQAIPLPGDPSVPTISSVKDGRGTEIPHGGTTYAAAVTLAGTAQTGQTVEVWKDGVQKGTSPVDGVSRWTFHVVGLAVGTNNFQIRGKYGSQPVSSIRSLIVGNPVITSVTDPQGVEIHHRGTTSARAVTLAGAVPAGQTVEVWHNGNRKGTLRADDNGAWSMQVSGLAAGTNDFQIRGLYGNQPVSALRSLTVVGR